jgi:hypothetical protein
MSISLLNQTAPLVTISGGSQWSSENFPFQATVTQLTSGEVWGSLGLLATGSVCYRVEPGVVVLPQAAADLLDAQAKLLAQGLLFFGPTFYGQTELDFGNAAGGNSWAETTILDPGVKADSRISAWLPAATTADHTEQEHQILNIMGGVHAGTIVPGVSFNLYINTSLRVRGKFKVGYSRD